MIIVVVVVVVVVVISETVIGKDVGGSCHGKV
jgi:hypothetical protein